MWTGQRAVVGFPVAVMRTPTNTARHATVTVPNTADVLEVPDSDSTQAAQEPSTWHHVLRELRGANESHRVLGAESPRQRQLWLLGQVGQWRLTAW